MKVCDRRRVGDVQYAFLELPRTGHEHAPHGIVEQWAGFFGETRSLSAVPLGLPHPVRRALDAARTGAFMEAEWEADERSCMAEQDARGAITFAQR